MAGGSRDRVPSSRRRRLHIDGEKAHAAAGWLHRQEACVLGLGVSHPPVNGALGIEVRDPPVAVADYAAAVQRWLRGEGPPTHLPQRPAPRPVPVYVAALPSRTVERASEIADGIMPLFWSTARVERSAAWTAGGRAEAPDRGPLDVTLGLPTFVGDDLDALRDAARQNLALYTTFPYFQHLFRASGFATEAEQMEARAPPSPTGSSTPWA